MSTKDFAETLVEAFWKASTDFWKATNEDIGPTQAKYLKAEKDLLQALRVPSPPSEDFLTPRDQFAMAALPAIIPGTDPKIWAATAYEVADAMMKAREVKHG